MAKLFRRVLGIYEGGDARNGFATVGEGGGPKHAAILVRPGQFAKERSGFRSFAENAGGTGEEARSMIVRCKAREGNNVARGAELAFSAGSITSFKMAVDQFPCYSCIGTAVCTYINEVIRDARVRSGQQIAPPVQYALTSRSSFN